MTELHFDCFGDIASNRIPDYLRAIGEGIYDEMSRRFLFLLDFNLMVNHDVGAGSYCYHLLVFRKNIRIARINDPGNKLSFGLYADSIQAFVVGVPRPGSNTIANYDYNDPDLFDNLINTIGSFFNCPAHQFTG